MIYGVRSTSYYNYVDFIFKMSVSSMRCINVLAQRNISCRLVECYVRNQVVEWVLLPLKTAAVSNALMDVGFVFL